MVEDYSPDPGGDKLLVANDAGATATYTTVSYTHLTLPTIYPV